MIAVVLVAAVVAIGELINLAAATFVVVLYTAVFGAATMLGLKPLEALPLLEVGIWRDGELVTSYTRAPDRDRPPIDIDACLRNALRAVRGQIPAPPPPPSTAALLRLPGLEGLGDFASLESREQAVERLESELTKYERSLREWLNDFESRRWPNYAIVRAQVAIRNRGENVADDITLRIILPDGLTPADDALGELVLAPPPLAPKYEQRSRFGISDLDLASVKPFYDPPFFPAVSTHAAIATGPSYVVDHGQDVAEVRLGSLTHGVTVRSADDLGIIPREPRTYVLRWEAHVANLRRPARGTIRIDVKPLSEEGQPLTTVQSVLDPGYVKVADD